MEAYSPDPNIDHTDITELANRVARIFGYDGLAVEVRPGQGWATQRSENSIKLIVDPVMLSNPPEADATGKPLATDRPAASEAESVYGICHELGHIEDYLHPSASYDKLSKQTPADQFFWNILDDSVINTRLRNVPMLNGLTNAVYENTLFPEDDLTTEPKHAQFMHGLLLRSVTPQRQITLSPDVTEALEGLESVRLGKLSRRTYDLYDTLSDYDTDLPTRRALATKHILPIYRDFLEEDKQKQQGDSGNSGQQGQSSADGNAGGPGDPSDPSVGGGDGSSFDGIYEAYADATRCSGHDHGDNDGTESSDQQSKDAGKDDAHKAIEAAAQEMRDKDKSAASDDKSTAGEADDLGRDQANNQNAGTIAAELNIAVHDAAVYAALLNKLRPQIKEVSEIFQKLAVPSIEYTSPRYRKNSSAFGSKLSPRDLFRVIVASQSEEDPIIWRPVETISKKEGYTFNGLDVTLVVDVSGSMRGSKAENAAACNVLLTEGLEAARRAITIRNPRAPKPDVRLGAIIFGSSHRVTLPLGHQPEPKAKGQTFSTIRAAVSSSTLVAGALKETVTQAAKNPLRTQLVFLITDGAFGDTASATQVLRQAASNYYLFQYILQAPGVSAITPNVRHFDDAGQLPANLKGQLKKIADRL
ncbi:MAG: hypothetical protein JWN38_1044 [Candidatus Saccharibacteria bacterium]|nr:hypothetical protein [Candidatus Saccharibacteria bacterium]